MPHWDRVGMAAAAAVGALKLVMTFVLAPQQPSRLNAPNVMVSPAFTAMLKLPEPVVAGKLLGLVKFPPIKLWRTPLT